jgi:hypothetical protein
MYKMSATQAMSSARRRRGNQQPASKPAARGTGDMLRQQPDVPSNEIEHSADRIASFVPTPVPAATTPSELVFQHDRRLFNLENGMAEAIGVINSNIDVLTDGYNSVAQGTDASVINSLRAEIRSLSSRMTALEDARSANSDDEEVTVSFTKPSEEGMPASD